MGAEGSLPGLKTRDSLSAPSSGHRLAYVHQALSDTLEQHVIVPVPVVEQFQGFYFNPFSIPKPTGGISPILDLKTPNVKVQHFHIESTIIASIHEGDFLLLWTMHQ